MVINRKCFLGKLVVYSDGAECDVGLKGLNKLETQLTLECPRASDPVAVADLHVFRAADQVTVIGSGQWKALRYARQGAPLAVGRDQYIFGLVQDPQEALQFLGIVVPVHVEIEIERENPSETVQSVQSQWQAIIPFAFIRHRESPQNDLSTLRP